jgi:sigma-B regulation protein RsbU (phosphoserine phosphatase)
MLFRQASKAVERLDEGGGPVVGLMPDCAYQQAEVALHSGDMLLIYTDGFSEAMNPRLEEWGEKRLMAAASASLALGAEEMITAIMRAADAYAAGAPQSDDMTLVVMRVL